MLWRSDASRQAASRNVWGRPVATSWWLAIAGAAGWARGGGGGGGGGRGGGNRPRGWGGGGGGFAAPPPLPKKSALPPARSAASSASATSTMLGTSARSACLTSTLSWRRRHTRSARLDIRVAGATDDLEALAELGDPRLQ